MRTNKLKLLVCVKNSIVPTVAYENGGQLRLTQMDDVHGRQISRLQPGGEGDDKMKTLGHKTCEARGVSS